MVVRIPLISFGACILVLGGCGSGSTRSDVAASVTTAPVPSSTEPAAEAPGTTAAGPTPASTAAPSSDVAPTAGSTAVVVAPSVTGSSGCSAPVQPSGRQDLVITSGDRQRTIHLLVPVAYDGTTPVPLVVDYHGHGGSGRNAERQHGFDPLADEDTVVMAYPDGTITQDGKTGWHSGVGRGISDVDDVKFSADLIDAVEARLCIDPARVFATGHSNGGGMTGVLACELTDRFTAFAAVSAALPKGGDCPATMHRPLLEIHGLADTVVPYGGTAYFPAIPDWLKEWADRKGCDPTPTVDGETSTWQGCDSPLEHVAIAGQGHEYAPGAAARIWTFFGLPTH